MRGKAVQRFYDDKGILVSKQCGICHEIKPVSEFNKDKSKEDGLLSKCKECKKQYSKQYQKDNSEKIKKHKKQYYEDNAEKIKKRSKQYYEDNAETKKQYSKQYKNQKIQKALQQIKTEVETNPEKYNYIEDKDIYGIIYLVHNIESNRYYVGQTITAFDIRYQSGWLYSHEYKDTVKEDLTLYGKDSFKYTKTFKVAHSQYELDKLEAYYIDYYDSYKNGYNENRGYIFTDRGK